jgi:hypothetical protein
MQPVRPTSSTHIFGADQAGVRPLHVRVSADRSMFTSAWKPSPEELEILLKGGVVEVHIIGGQPPILCEIAPGE